MARSPKVLVAKTGLDGHWRGVLVVASTLRDAGFEVIMLGMANADEIVASAVQEDVDIVGLNVGGRIEVVERIIDRLRNEGVAAPVMAGGTIAPQWQERLQGLGVELFPPGSALKDIVTTARRLAGGRERSEL
ncbi:MAG: cobalamin-binding protein [Propionibacteriales bacterium]|nr:cobalamin-binding protein [Propionibacteriales bacterium]